MTVVTKNAQIIGLSEGGNIDDGSGGLIETMNLALVLGKGTPGEQRVGFMVLKTDYETLGSPGYGASITVTLNFTP